MPFEGKEVREERGRDSFSLGREGWGCQRASQRVRTPASLPDSASGAWQDFEGDGTPRRVRPRPRENGLSAPQSPSKVGRKSQRG